MLVIAFFVADFDGTIKMYLEEPCRLKDEWCAKSDFCMIFEDSLPESEQKEKISALTWEDEPFKCELELSIQKFCGQ